MSSIGGLGVYLNNKKNDVKVDIYKPLHILFKYIWPLFDCMKYNLFSVCFRSALAAVFCFSVIIAHSSYGALLLPCYGAHSQP